MRSSALQVAMINADLVSEMMIPIIWPTRGKIMVRLVHTTKLRTALAGK